MVIAEIIGGVVTIGLLLIIVYNLIKWVTNDTSSQETETVTVEETANVSHYFTRKHATVTFPDGSDEDVIYDDRVESDSRVTLSKFSEDSFEITRGFDSGRPMMSKSGVPLEDTRMFSMSNIRDIDIERTDKMVAAAEVDVEREKVSYPSGDMYTKHTRFDKQADHDVAIWYRSEWTAHIDRDDS